MATLSILSGPGKGGESPLGAGSHVIGTDELVCDVVLYDDKALPRHMVLTVLDDDTVCAELPEGAEAVIGGRLVGPGEYLLDGSGEFRIGGTMLRCRQQRHRRQKKSPPTKAAPPELVDEVKVPPAKRRGGFAALATGAVCVSISGFLVVANGSTPAAPDASQQVKAALSRLGRADLAVGRNAAGGLVVTGFVRDAGERKELEAALQRDNIAGVAWRLSMPGQVRQFEPVAVRGGGSAVHLDGNTLLLDALPKSPEGAPSVVELRISSLHIEDEDAPFMETSDGERFELGAMLPGGYRLTALTKEAIVLARGGDRIIYTVR